MFCTALKVFESLEGGTAVVFELAVFPPRRVDEGFGTDSGFSFESKELTCRMDVSCEDANGMFVSASEAMEEERRQLEEAERRNRGGVDRSYDVLAQMQNKVGGLGSELQTLARRILISRQLPAEVLRDLGDHQLDPTLTHSFCLLCTVFFLLSSRAFGDALCGRSIVLYDMCLLTLYDAHEWVATCSKNDLQQHRSRYICTY
jgi:hypothetical protein